MEIIQITAHRAALQPSDKQTKKPPTKTKSETWKSDWRSKTQSYVITGSYDLQTSIRNKVHYKIHPTLFLVCVNGKSELFQNSGDSLLRFGELIWWTLTSLSRSSETGSDGGKLVWSKESFGWTWNSPSGVMWPTGEWRNNHKTSHADTETHRRLMIVVLFLWLLSLLFWLAAPCWWNLLFG